MRVSKQTHSALFSLLRQLGYRKHSATVRIAEQVALMQPYWSGGSRQEHWQMDLEQARLHPVQLNSNPWPEPPAETVVLTSPGLAIVTGGVFMGKSAYWTIYLHVADKARFDLQETTKL